MRANSSTARYKIFRFCINKKGSSLKVSHAKDGKRYFAEIQSATYSFDHFRSLDSDLAGSIGDRRPVKSDGSLSSFERGRTLLSEHSV